MRVLMTIALVSLVSACGTPEASAPDAGRAGSERHMLSAQQEALQRAKDAARDLEAAAAERSEVR